MPNEDKGSFSLGFTFGLLAGAAGFFIFGTEQGKRARRQFSQQWQKAQESSAKNLDIPPPTLRAACKGVIAAILEDKTTDSSSKNKAVKKRKRTQKAKVKPKTFTGT